MTWEWILSACMGLGLAACCGFRVFVPLLMAGLATKIGLISPLSGMDWVSTWPGLIGLSVATVFELGAYYIPWLDNLLDTLAAPAAVIAGTLLSTSFFHINSPVLDWGLGLILGGGAAGLVQAGTSLLRLGSTATTGGLGNPVVATTENLASFGLSLFTLLLPLIAFVVIALILAYIVVRLLTRRRIWFSKPNVQPGNPIDKIPRSSNGKA